MRACRSLAYLVADLFRSRVLSYPDGDVQWPDWWRYPVACPRGHPRAPGRVIVSWTPCRAA